MHSYSFLMHNWLALKINNETLNKHLEHITGVVYDLGCGKRPYEKDILTVATKYIGIDWSCTQHGMHADIIADLNRALPVENEVADTIVSFQVLEHLYEPQIVLNESHRILKSKGTVLLTVPFQWWIHEAPHDFFRYTPYGLVYLFENAGFVDVVVKPQSGFFSMWILKMNYFSNRFVRGPKAIRWFVRISLLPFWFAGQVVAPLLDKLDRNWASEASGYCVTARKP